MQPWQKLCRIHLKSTIDARLKVSPPKVISDHLSLSVNSNELSANCPRCAILRSERDRRGLLLKGALERDLF
ncbi:hypothetical protein ACKFKF_26440 [Phormidesmis sp. 146-12]